MISSTKSSFCPKSKEQHVINSQNCKKRRSTLSTKESNEKYNCLTTKIGEIQRPSLVYVEKFDIIRADAYGSPIQKGSKEHKVTFADIVSTEPIAEVILYNNDNNLKKNQENHPKIHCADCIIF